MFSSRLFHLILQTFAGEYTVKKLFCGLKYSSPPLSFSYTSMQLKCWLKPGYFVRATLVLVGLKTSLPSGERVSSAEHAESSGHSSYLAERTCASKNLYFQRVRF